MPTKDQDRAAKALAKPPEKLGPFEFIAAAVLVAVGAFLVFWTVKNVTGPEGAGLLSKTVTTTKEAGENAATTTDEKNYADTFAIFALTAGAALIVAGAFYGRIRELKLGALSAQFGELPPEKDQELVKKVEEAADEKGATPEEKKKLKEVAPALAREAVRQQYWGVVPEPPADDLKGIAEGAVDKARSLASSPSGEVPRNRS